MPLSTSDRNSLLRTAGYQAPGDQTKADLVTAAGAAGGTALGLPLGNKLEQFLKQVPQYDPRMKRLEGILQRGIQRGDRLDTKGLTSIADKQAGKLQALFNRTGKLTKGYGRAGKVGAILAPLLAATGGAFGGQAMGRKWYPNKPLPTDTPPGFPKVREGMMLGYGMGKSASAKWRLASNVGKVSKRLGVASPVDNRHVTALSDVGNNLRHGGPGRSTFDPLLERQLNSKHLVSNIDKGAYQNRLGRQFYNRNAQHPMQMHQTATPGRDTHAAFANRMGKPSTTAPSNQEFTGQVFRGAQPTASGSPNLQWGGGYYGGAMNHATPFRQHANQYGQFVNHYNAPAGSQFGRDLALESKLLGKSRHLTRNEPTRLTSLQRGQRMDDVQHYETAISPRTNTYQGTEFGGRFFPASDARGQKALGNYFNNMSRPTAGAPSGHAGNRWDNTLSASPRLNRMQQSNPGAFNTLMHRRADRMVLPQQPSGVKTASVGNHAMAGLMSLLGVSLGVGTANTLYAHGAMAGADDLTDPHKGSVRGKLLDLAKEKDVFVGYPHELAKERFGGNPNVERQLNRMGPFYAKDLPPGSGPAIMKSKLFDRNGILAHELGHATDSEFVHDMQIKGQQVSPLLTLGILLGKGKSMGLSKMFAGAATGAQLPILYGEGSASIRGAKHMADAGAKGVKELAEPFMGLPTYIAGASIPTLTYLLKKRMLR